MVSKKRSLSFLTLSILVFFAISVSVSAQTYSSCGDVPDEELNQRGVARVCQEVTECGIYTESDTYYLLMNDVRSNHTCMMFPLTDNVVFNMNEYTVTFNDAPFIDFENSGFEEPLGPDNWQILNHEELVQRRYKTGHLYPLYNKRPMDDFFWGDYVLEIKSTPNLADNITIRSSTVTLPEPEWYTGWIFGNRASFSGPGTFMRIVNADTGTIICEDDDAACNFQVAEPTNVYLEFGITDNPTDANKTFFFDFAGIAPYSEYGIFSKHYTDDNNQYHAPGHPGRSSERLVVKNGNVIQGASKSPSVAAIRVQGDEIIVEDTYTEIYGIQSPNIHVFDNEPGMKGPDIRNNLARSYSPYAFNRHSLTAVIGVAASELSDGQCDIINNTVLGGMQNGISMTSHCVVANNTVKHNATVTNAFAIIVYGPNNVTIENNHIDSKGRGITLEGASNVIVRNNFVRTRDKPSEEYYDQAGYGMGSQAMKVEGDAPNMLIENNHVISRSWELWDDTAVAMKVAANIDNLTIRNNTFEAYTNPDKTAPYGHLESYLDGAIAFNMIGDYSTSVVENNHFISNNILLFRGREGVLDSNTFEYSGPSHEDHPPAFWYIGRYDPAGPVHFLNSTMIETSYDNLSFDYILENYWNYTVDWYLTVLVENPQGEPQDTAQVLIENALGEEAYTGTTGPDGMLTTSLPQYFRYGEPSYMNHPYVEDTYTPYTITVTKDTLQAVDQVDLTESKSVTIIISDVQCDLPYDYDPCGTISSTELSNAISAWYANDLTMTEMLGLIVAWKS